MMKSNRSILYKQKRVILTIVDGVLHLVCAVYLRYTLLKFYLAVMYIRTKSDHFDAMTITVVMLGKFICTFFLMGRSRTFFGQGSNFIWGWQKEGVRGSMGGEAQNEGYFYKIPIIQQDINFISQTFGQTNF